MHTAHSPHKAPTTALISVVRERVARYVAPLEFQSEKKSLSGKTIGLRIHLPDAGDPFVTVNIWVPHQGTPARRCREAFSDLDETIHRWQQGPDGKQLLVLTGDMNATWHPEEDSASVRPCFERLQGNRTCAGVKKPAHPHSTHTRITQS